MEGNMRKPELGFTARETAPGAYQFQAVIYTASRTGEPMPKTLNPHDRLLDEQEVRQLGYDTIRLIKIAQEQRAGLPEYQWRYHAINWQDLW
jgi:hypothetical protein